MFLGKRKKRSKFLKKTLMSSVILILVLCITGVVNAVVDQQNSGDTSSGKVKYFGQSFTQANSGYLASVNLYVTGQNANPSNLTISIYGTDSSGIPTGTVIATSNLVTINNGKDITIPTKFSFNSRPFLNSGTKYAMLVTSADNNSYYKYKDSNSYSGGDLLASSNGTSWTKEIKDLAFQTLNATTASVTYAKNPVKPGDSQTITATFSEPLKDTPIVKVAISGANTVAATEMIKTDTTHYTYTYTIGSGNGTANVSFSVGTDAADNIITATPTSGGSFIVDNTVPTISAVSINDGAEFTTSINVNVKITASDTGSGLDKVSLSNDNSNWTEYTFSGSPLTIPWTLTYNAGTKTVYVKCVDKAGNTSTVSSDTIVKIVSAQKFVLDSMGLSSADDRQAISNKLAELLSDRSNISQITTAIWNTSLKNTMTTDEIQDALVTISYYTPFQRAALGIAIKDGYQTLSGDGSSFATIKAQINKDITGFSSDDRGLKFMVVFLNKTKYFTGVTKMAFDGTPINKILLKLENPSNSAYITHIKGVLGTILNSLNSLSFPHASFDAFLSNYQDFINGKSDSEISGFKTFLRNNGDIY